MRKYVVGLTMSVALCAPAVLCGQEDAGAFAGWAALANTPVGAFAPMLVLPPVGGGALPATLFQFRYGRYNFEGEGGVVNNFGVGMSLSTGTSRLTFEIGFLKPECDGCRAIIGGADMTFPLTALTTPARNPQAAVFSVAINPAVGFMKDVSDDEFDDDSDGSALSLAASVPLAVTFKSGEKLRLAPFLSPGVGFGRISTGNGSESGFRGMLGGGLTIAGLSPDLQLTIGFRKIFLDEFPTTFGIGMTLGK